LRLSCTDSTTKRIARYKFINQTYRAQEIVDLAEKTATTAKLAPAKSAAIVKKRPADDMAASPPAKVSKIADFFPRDSAAPESASVAPRAPSPVSNMAMDA
jgi:hypothetical protein